MDIRFGPRGSAPGGPVGRLAAVARALLSTRPRRVLAAVIVAALALLGLRAARGREAPGWAVERRTLVQRVVASGRVLPPARVSVGPLSLARVLEVAMREGDRVEAGQVLVRLDDAEPKAALAQARARVAEAAARLDQVRGPGAKGAAETLRQADVKVALAEQALARARALAVGGAASAAQLEEAEQSLALARSAREGAAAQAASLAGAGPDDRLALAALLGARAAEDAARARLDEKTLRAPAPAQVLLRDAEPGDVVPAGKPLVVLSLVGGTRLQVQPDEKNLAVLRVGQAARAVADAFPGEPFDARVAWVAPSVDPARGTVEVRLEVAAPPPYLRPDMTVSVNVVVARREGALVLPADAIVLAGRGAGVAPTPGAPAGPFVWVVADGRAVRRAVTLGIRGEGTVEVASGLAEGDLVLAPATAPAEGARVRVKRLPAPVEAVRAL